jgi:hypothetical protein
MVKTNVTPNGNLGSEINTNKYKVMRNDYGNTSEATNSMVKTNVTPNRDLSSEVKTTMEQDYGEQHINNDIHNTYIYIYSST